MTFVEFSLLLTLIARHSRLYSCKMFRVLNALPFAPAANGSFDECIAATVGPDEWLERAVFNQVPDVQSPDAAVFLMSALSPYLPNAAPGRI